MARRTRAPSIDDKIAALRSARLDTNSESALHLIREALKDSNWLVVSEAAEIIVQQGLRNFSEPLLDVWPRFCDNAVKRDPGCRAKQAALKALDYSEWLDPDPFLAAIRYRQLEPALGGKVDTAGGLRVRALLALLRMGYSKATLYAGELMADPDPQVRVGVARAIGHYEDRNSVALLVYKLCAGDDDPVLLLECALALLTIDVEFGLGWLVPQLSEPNEAKRETAALALGQSRNSKANQALLEWVDGVSFDRDHDLGIRALGFSRYEPARLYLLGLVKSGALARARASVQALAVQSYDPQLSRLVRDAAKQRGDAPLCEFVERVFGG